MMKKLKQISINFKKKFHHQSAATRTKGEKVTKIEKKKESAENEEKEKREKIRIILSLFVF